MPIDAIVTKHVNGDKIIPAGLVLYHGFRFNDDSDIDFHLQGRIWLTPDRQYAGDYGYHVADLPIKKLWKFKVVEPVLLVKVACFNMLTELNKNKLLVKKGPDFQREDITDIASRLFKKNYGGIYDHGGHEILIVSPKEHLSVVDVLDLPATKNEWAKMHNGD